MNGTLTSSHLFHASNTITSDATITNTANVRFWAADEIELTDGFDAQAGSEFIAEIKPCITQLLRTRSPQVQQTEYSLPSMKPEILLFPNPVRSGDGLTVRHGNPTEQNAQLALYDLQGRVIIQVSLAHGEQHLKLSKKLLPGAYLWRATGGNQSLGSGTLIVQ